MQIQTTATVNFPTYWAWFIQQPKPTKVSLVKALIDEVDGNEWMLIDKADAHPDMKGETSIVKRMFFGRTLL